MVTDLALILIVASVVTLLFKKLNQPLVLGYIVAGFLVSPHMPYVASVTQIENVHTWADIGVMFLLFTLGLEFSFKKILKMGIAPVIAVITIIFAMITLGITVGQSFGWGYMDSLFLGGMLSMSSTTIIYKAFDELGLRQKRFTSLVMSVLILEDILAIVMMVMLSGVARTNSVDGGELIGSVLTIGYFLVVWFVVGIFFVPWILRASRKLLNAETLLIFSLGLCCAMAVLSETVGFSQAFGAFVMGSILAETVEAEKIEHLVAPVKNLFGAIFFVSVGMLVDPAILVDYAWPIIGLVLTILIGQSVFGTLGYLFSGQSLKTAMRCGFSMAQIGEFAFIIASLGLSLGVISQFLYPVVVTVSVITTFLTPYMIRASEPAYGLLERYLPKSFIKRAEQFSAAKVHSQREAGMWRSYLLSVAIAVVINAIIAISIVTLMLVFAKPVMFKMLPEPWGKIVFFAVTVTLMAPFLRSVIMKKTKGEHAKALIAENRVNGHTLNFIFVVKVCIVLVIMFSLWHEVWRVQHTWLMIAVCLAAVIAMIKSESLQRNSRQMERILMENLESREKEARAKGRQRPLFESRLIDQALHIGLVQIPAESLWAGKSLAQLMLGNRFGVHVSSVIRGDHRFNIPGGDFILFPHDRLNVIGNDEQLTLMSQAAQGELLDEDFEIEKRDMSLKQITLGESSPLVGKSLLTSGLRSDYGCMLVGIDQGQQNLTQVDPQHVFQVGDIIWVVGEESSIDRLEKPAKDAAAED